MSSHKLLSLFEAIFKFKLLGPHCVTAGKAGFQLMGPHVDLLAGEKKAILAGESTAFLQGLWLLEVLSQLGMLFPIHPLSGPLHIQLGSRESQYKGHYGKDRGGGQRP